MSINFRDTRNKRTEAQKAADAAFIEHWCVRGKSERQVMKLIAENRPYTLSIAQVHNDIAKLKHEWRAQAITERTAMVADELKGMKAQEDELWAAWEKSKTNAIKNEEEVLPATNGKKTKKDVIKRKTTTEGQCGDASYMRLILEIRATRRALLGLDAMHKVDITSGGSPLPPAVINPTVIINIVDNGRDRHLSQGPVIEQPPAQLPAPVDKPPEQ